MMKRLSNRHPLILCGGLWGLLVAIILLTRPLLTTIETRAMTVAWEMFVQHDYLVPTLNFKPYTQKPPMLAWLINLAWLLVGVRETVGTVIASLFGFGCVAWTYAIARRLWPHDLARATQAAWLCFGAAAMQVYGTLVFYDIILTFFVLGCVYMLLQSARTHRMRYTIGLGVFIGLAGLTKGPVILVHSLPLALLAPVWTARQTGKWSSWYSRLLLSILIGATIGLSWALPAALQGGHDYARWILLQQTTRRVVNAFNHQHQWWFYIAVMPGLVLPWLFLPSLWRRVNLLQQVRSEPTLRFLLCWIGSVFIVFTLISGKQLHYLLPLWPAFALLLAWLLPALLTRRDLAVGAMPFFLFGVVWTIVLILLRSGILNLHQMWDEILTPYPWLPALYTLAIGLLFAAFRRTPHKIIAITLMMWLSVIAIHITSIPQGFSRFTAEPIATALRSYPNRPVAVVSARYQGDVNFLARVTEPLTILPLANPSAIARFFALHPDGLVLQQVRTNEVITDYHVLYTQPARAKRVYVLMERRP